MTAKLQLFTLSTKYHAKKIKNEERLEAPIMNKALSILIKKVMHEKDGVHFHK